MYERFTDRARKVMQLANSEARRLKYDRIDTCHILLGLIAEGSGVAAHVIKESGINLESVKDEVEKKTGIGPGETLGSAKRPQTVRAKKVIEYAMEEARGLEHDYVGTEHILLGLIREAEGVPAQLLTKLGLTLQQARTNVLKLLGHNESDKGES